MPRSLTVVAACVLALALAGMAGADGAPLSGSVGPGFTISLQDASGSPVSHLDPGTFALTIDDRSDEHDFHLRGPGGVDVATDVAEIATRSFTVNLVDGKYTFFCDAHPLRMKGSFVVGTPPPPPPAPRLLLTVTSKAITLTTATGKAVQGLVPGPYVIVVRDRSKVQNARVIAPGVNRATGIAFVGTATWSLTLPSGTFRYRSDAKRPKLRAGQVYVVG